MEINFNVTGAERKRLAQAVAQSTGDSVKYLGLPSWAFTVGPFTISKDGVLSFGEGVDAAVLEKLFSDLQAEGFAFDAPAIANEPEAQDEEAPASTEPAFIIPEENLSSEALQNLQSLLIAKGSLIKKALGVEGLPLELLDDTVAFPWFEGRLLAPEEERAYTRFISALCDMARNQIRIVAKEKETDNEKYSFRCFLLRLGFIGPELKQERKILLRNLTGSSAFRNGGESHEIAQPANS